MFWMTGTVFGTIEPGKVVFKTSCQAGSHTSASNEVPSINLFNTDNKQTLTIRFINRYMALQTASVKLIVKTAWPKLELKGFG